jgi:hypothetical protein
LLNSANADTNVPSALPVRSILPSCPATTRMTAPEHLPSALVVAGHRCLTFDLVSARPGGPDFRLELHRNSRIW